MSLTQQQVEHLLKPIKPGRVLRDNKGMAHVSQQDIRANLTRCFGFGGWSSSITDLTLVREAHAIKSGKEQDGWAVTYRAVVRLDIRDPQGQPVASFEDVATGTSPNLPSLGDAHDFACKVAVSMALKRAATNLGDGFGLSLYNKGQMTSLVIGTLVMPEGPGRDATDEIPTQVSMGHDDAGSAEPEDPPSSTPSPSLGVEPAAAPPTEHSEEALRAQVLAAIALPDKNEALRALTRVNIELGRRKLANTLINDHSGDMVKWSLFVDSAIKHVQRKAS